MARTKSKFGLLVAGGLAISGCAGPTIEEDCEKIAIQFSPSYGGEHVSEIVELVKERAAAGPRLVPPNGLDSNVNSWLLQTYVVENETLLASIQTVATNMRELVALGEQITALGGTGAGADSALLDAAAAKTLASEQQLLGLCGLP